MMVMAPTTMQVACARKDDDSAGCPLRIRAHIVDLGRKASL